MLGHSPDNPWRPLMEPKVLWAVMAGRETEAHFTTPVEAVAWLHRRPWVRPTSWLDDGFRYVEVH